MSQRPAVPISKYSRRVYGLGNIHKSGNGYRLRVVGRDHPHADARGRVYEHILIAEKALGRVLPKKAQVHHVDHDKAGNRNNNLVICEDDSYHKLLHERERAYRATGDPTAQTCGFCGKWMVNGDPNTYIYHAKSGRVTSHHRTCKTAYDATYYIAVRLGKKGVLHAKT